MTLTELKQFVGNTLIQNTLVPQYIISKTNAPRPLGIYGVIDINSFEQVAWSYKKFSSKLDDIDLETKNLYTATMQIDIFRGQSRDQILVFTHSLVKQSVIDDWANNNVGLISRGSVIDVSQLQDASIEERATIEIIVMFEHTINEDVIGIDNVCIFGDIDNGAEIIETIEIGGGTQIKEIQLIQPSDVADYDYSGSDAVLSNNSMILVTGSPTADSEPAIAVQAIIPNYASFGGLTYLDRQDFLFDAIESPQGILSFSFYVTGGDGTERFIYNNANNSVQVYLRTTNFLIIDIYAIDEEGDGSLVLTLSSTNTILASNARHNVVASWDLETPTSRLYLDDVAQSVVIQVQSTDNLPYNQDEHYIAAKNITPDSAFVGCLSEFFFIFDEYLDLDIETNRLKFFDANGDSVGKGVSGEIPTGNPPIIYLTGDENDFQINSGFGGNFTVAGNALAPCDIVTSVANTGKVYTYDVDVNGFMVNEQILVSPDAITLDRFGHGVYVGGEGNTVIASAQKQNSTVEEGGAVYIFKRPGSLWAFTQKLTPLLPLNAFDRFGFSIGMSDDELTIVVGAPGEDNGGNNQGAVYIFEWDGNSYLQSARIVLTTPIDEDRLGQVVYITRDGLTVFAGAIKADLSGQVAVIHKGVGWSDGFEDSIIIASDASASDYFGTGVVSIDVYGGFSITADANGNNLIIGAYGWSSQLVNNKGKVYHFIKNGLAYEEQPYGVFSTDIQAFSLFGYTVSVSEDGGTLLVSSQSQDSAGEFNTGKAFLYSLSVDQYVPVTSFTANVKSQNSFFGYKVFIDNTGLRAIITASDYNGNGIDQGASYLYELPNCSRVN